MPDKNHRRPLGELSVAEKLLLVQDLWDSIAADQGTASLTDQQRAELDRRLDAYEANPDEFITWEQIQTSLRNASH